MGRYCVFCNRRADECPGGVWCCSASSREGICRYCARKAIRSFGEVPDPTPAEPVSIFTRLPWSGPGDAA